MSEESARIWLSHHHDIIPALEVNHRQSLRILEDHSATLHDLADVIALDPGMSVSLYHEFNSNLQGTNRQSADSVHAILSRLGDGAIADLVMEHRVLDETHPDALRRQNYHQLMSRSYHLLAQLDSFAGTQGIRAINEIRSAALLYNIGEFCACLFDHDRYQRYQDKFCHTGSDTISARSIYGFDFHQLGRVYAEKVCLPPLVAESLDENVPAGREARLIQLAADISHQAEIGWYHTAMKAAEEVCANYLNQSVEGFEKHLHQVAIECARANPFDDVLPAACRLIMLPDLERPAKPPPRFEVKADPAPEIFHNRIKALLHTHRPTQAQLLDLLLGHLHDDLHLTRVALLLMSRDRSKIGTCAGRGIDEHSPIRTLVIDIDRAGLLQAMMSESLALWVEPENYHEYEKTLPAKFKAAFLHESFLLMPLQVAERPAGMIYADRTFGVNPLDKDTYAKFKAAILLTSKALAYLAGSKEKAAG
ncbi:MAG: HDOD domain-containing protein [Gammaproteobacteria bacterium]|jgi:hypothetical protein